MPGIVRDTLDRSGRKRLLGQADSRRDTFDRRGGNRQQIQG